MNILRRLYYDKATGDMIMWYRVRTTQPTATVVQDFETENQLAAYKDRPNDVGLIEWRAPDEAIDYAFENMYEVRVDVHADPPVPVFNFEFPDEPEDPTE